MTTIKSAALGVRNSSRLDLSQTGKLTTGQSNLFKETISGNSSSATSSSEFSVGLRLSDSQASPRTEQSGLDRAHASPSAPLGDKKESMTSATYGRSSSASSRSAALQLSLESKLRQNLAGNGSPMYELTWKHWDMLREGRICALRGRARHISGSGSTGWLTPCARDWKGYTKRAGESLCNQLSRLYGGTGTPNPKWIAWLMGYPLKWDDCAVSAMPSSRKLRRSL